MTKNYLYLILILLCIALVSGILSSDMTLVGNLGIGIFYQELSFFKTWWQSALVFFATLLVLFWVLWLIGKRLTGTIRKLVFGFLFVLFMAGLYFTYKDFNTDLAHSMMGTKFHISIYLYWIGASIISLFLAKGK